ncbi:uncharacterized protein [Argopecten irradians]|uniref:uncharacterized protein n=1 Tax=Argopecten irradians TaxID=31199 RepID=UPI00371E23F9
MEVFYRVFLSGLTLAWFICMSDGKCRQMPLLTTYNSTALVPKSSFGLQQCERECFSNANCKVMVYHLKNLECFQMVNVSNTPSTERDFVVKLRTDIAADLDSSFLCYNHQCENGFYCVRLKSGLPVCIVGQCGEPVSSVSNAVVTAQSYFIASTATYSCVFGYYPYGETQVTCKSSFQWSDPSLVCVKDEFSYHPGTQMMYRVFPSTNMIYSNALSHCESLGAGLVKVNTTARKTALSGYLASGQYYTDASDLDIEGTWVFSDGSSVDMALFKSGEPDGGTGENCAIFGVGSQLYDVNCESARLFICEIR